MSSRDARACLGNGVTCYAVAPVNGAEFLRRAKRYARKRRLDYRFDRRRGKGSHGRLHIGGRLTTVPRKEIGTGLLASMLKDLGIDQEDF